MMMLRVYLILSLIIFCTKSAFYDGYFASRDECSCKQTESNLCCFTNTYEKYNHENISKIITKLVTRNFFRFYKVNLYNTCKFWPNERQCILKDCNVDSCSEQELPNAFKKGTEKDHETCSIGSDLNLHNIDLKLSDEELRVIEIWNKSDQSLDFIDAEDSPSDVQYVDLQKNPERYTGYSGQGAEKIWKSIYQDNCFLNLPEDSNKYENIRTCSEFKKFYRFISGFHTSVNIHLCSIYPIGDRFHTTWGMNISLLNKRFSNEYTNSLGQQWIRNAFLTHSLVARAIIKARLLWNTTDFFTGNEMDDKETKQILLDLVNSLANVPGSFNENSMFNDEENAPQTLELLRISFNNISRIMDCVACDKCRLWGKTQTQGLGTALKILFTPFNGKITQYLSPAVKLRRMEIVSLFNLFSRLSNTLNFLNQWRFHIEVDTPSQSDHKRDSL